MLDVINVKKVYSNGTEAVKNVSFHVKRGEVYGLIGPNGAGKSTTIKMIVTLLKPTSGRILIDDVDVVKDPLKTRSLISYLPEDVRGPSGQSVEDFLTYLASIYVSSSLINMKKDSVSNMIEKALRIADLTDDVRSKSVGSLSKGMFRRLMIGSVLMLDAPYIILDEPTSGVDVIESVKIRNIIKREAGRDKAVLFSSHNMLEVETLCDRVGFMYAGHIIAEGHVNDFVDEYENLENAFMSLIKEREDKDEVGDES